MKYTLPKGCGPVSHAGKALTIATDRSVDLDPSVAELLAPHEIVPVGDPAPVDLSQIDTMASADLVAALTARNVAATPTMSLATLRGLLRQALAKPTR